VTSALEDLLDLLRRHQREASLQTLSLGLDPHDELQELQRRILQHDPTLALAPAVEEPQAALPAPPNRLLGRKRELAEVRELLLRERVRLLVLIGAGGSGKTRLALEAARAIAGSFASGAGLVELAIDNKYYVRNIGLVREQTIQGGNDFLELVSMK
jgi:hypothetical protein